MRQTSTGNSTLLRIQQEISEVAARENELRNNHITTNGVTNENGSIPSFNRNMSVPAQPVTNGSCTRRFIPNSNSKGVMQKFFKARGRFMSRSISESTTQQSAPVIAWQATNSFNGPAKALIPTDKPLRKGYVPVEERIQKELRELKNREEELRTERRKSQPDLMLALEANQDESDYSPRSISPAPFMGRLRNARSYSHLLDEDYSQSEETFSEPGSLRPAKSLAELCDATDNEIISPRNLIQRWESRIQQSKEM